MLSFLNYKHVRPRDPILYHLLGQQHEGKIQGQGWFWKEWGCRKRKIRQLEAMVRKCCRWKRNSYIFFTGFIPIRLLCGSIVPDTMAMLLSAPIFFSYLTNPPITKPRTRALQIRIVTKGVKCRTWEIKLSLSQMKYSIFGVGNL